MTRYILLLLFLVGCGPTSNLFGIVAIDNQKIEYENGEWYIYFDIHVTSSTNAVQTYYYIENYEGEWELAYMNRVPIKAPRASQTIGYTESIIVTHQVPVRVRVVAFRGGEFQITREREFVIEW